MSFLSDLTETAPEPERWALHPDGGIVWDVRSDTRLPHMDRVEMSGQKISAVIHYGVDASGNLVLREEIIWPFLRLVPNDTYGSLGRFFDQASQPSFAINGKLVAAERLIRVEFDGFLHLTSEIVSGLEVARTIFPSPTRAALLENYVVANRGDVPLVFEVSSSESREETDPDAGADGAYCLTSSLHGGGVCVLQTGATVRFARIFTGGHTGEPPAIISSAQEEEDRRGFITEMQGSLQLETPDPLLDRMFSLSKIRAAESIYSTRGGLLHSPGGGLHEGTSSGKGRYYAAIWANDQAEYACPLFPYLGYATGLQAGLNAYRHFARYMNPEYRMLPSSIIAEGRDTWNDAGDRGDAAMIAYGTARFALASGNDSIAEELWPLVEWCLEYCRRQMNPEGVVASDSDELENRLPSGNANLHTSVLTYDALVSASHLARSLRRGEDAAAEFAGRAARLAEAIESYFGATVEGFATYRYYQGNTDLRAWICSPLVAGILARAKGTIAALTSARLWTADGLATASGRSDFWDRSTLYAIRGIFYAGDANTGLDVLHAYTRRRLSGEHVPYAVEAYPEGSQSHLAGESALYGRLYIEGMFGVRPTGLKTFSWKPALPAAWPGMALRRVRAFDETFDLIVRRTATGLELSVTCEDASSWVGVLQPGETMEVDLSDV